MMHVYVYCNSYIQIYIYCDYTILYISTYTLIHDTYTVLHYRRPGGGDGSRNEYTSNMETTYNI